MANKLFDSSDDSTNDSPEYAASQASSEAAYLHESLDGFSFPDAPASEESESKLNSSSSLEGQGGVDSPDILTTEELNQIAGNYNPEEDSLISKEFLIKQNQEAPTERSVSEKGSVRALTVTGGIGGIIALGAIVWFGFLQPKSPVDRAQVSEPEETPESPPPDQTAELRSQLAFVEQQRQLEATNKPPAETPRTSTTNPQNTQARETAPPGFSIH